MLMIMCHECRGEATKCRLATSIYFQAGSSGQKQTRSQSANAAFRGTTAVMALTQAREFPHQVQQPAPGPFTFEHLELATAQRSNPREPGEQQTAHYAFVASDGVPDLLKSYEDPGFRIQTSHAKEAADVKQPKTNSWIHKLHLHCSYGPKYQRQQSQKLKPKAAHNADSDKKRRRRLVDPGESRKRGSLPGAASRGCFCSQTYVKSASSA